MAEMNAKNRKLSMNLSLFTSTEAPTKPSTKSPRNFEGPNGVVGLGILAAMNNSNDEYCCQDPFFKRSTVLAISPRSLSNPIPIFNKKFTSLSVNNKNNSDKKDDYFTTTNMELCEEYTCVISHVGHNQIKKKEYFDDCSTNVVGHWVSSGVVVSTEVSSSGVSSHGGEMEAFPMAEFLSSCFLCKKQLHGLDIFMYRGEKAFCSAECRHKQISMDEHKEKSVPGMMKSLEYECSASPCSSPMQFFVGVAAA